jgi:TfoX/Sxy family transcriptional regulator of competence genes
VVAPGRRQGDNPLVAYDEELANRVRELVQGTHGITEMRMFGGLAFLVGGNLAVAVSGRGGLLLRVDPTDSEALVSEPDASRFVMRGREMDGWLHIDAKALSNGRRLQRWVGRGLAYAGSLPPKR